VEHFDHSVRLAGFPVHPAHPSAGTVSGAVVTVESTDLPLLDYGSGAEDLAGPIPDGGQLLIAGPHCFFGFPGAGRDAAACLAIDHHGQTDAAVNVAYEW